MSSLDEQLLNLKTNFGLELHETFISFLKASETIYDTSQKSIQVGVLKAWEGVSTPGPAAEPPEDEDSDVYWIHEIAYIHRIDDIIEMLTEAYLWSPSLSSIGYPIARGYDGAVYFQGVDGDIWHGFGDEWIQYEDHAELAKLGMAGFLENWGHNYIESGYDAFYKVLCERLGAS